MRFSEYPDIKSERALNSEKMNARLLLSGRYFMPWMPRISDVTEFFVRKARLFGEQYFLRRYVKRWSMKRMFLFFRSHRLRSRCRGFHFEYAGGDEEISGGDSEAALQGCCAQVYLR